jgi:Uncharacterised nucleotidyltransferase
MGSTPSLHLLTRLLSEPPDLAVISDPDSWAIVKANAGRHGAAPLIAFIARPHVSQPDRAWCDRILVSSWKRHEQNLQHLDYVLSILDDAAIPALTLKGPVMACRYYQPAFLRKSSGDLDLALRKEDFDRACEALARAGYVPEAGIRESKAISHHIELHHPSRPTLELHFRLTHKALGVPVAEFLDRAAVFSLPGGRRARILCPADEILHLVLHRASGRFATLFHLYEVRKIWAAAPLEVRREAVQIAARHHFTGVFAMTDIAFRTRWGEGMLAPGLILEPTWLHWRMNGKLYDEFERCSDPGRELPLSIRLKRKWVDLQMTDRPGDALRFLAEMARIARFQLFRKGWRTVKVS